jgi:outer membrane protein assembly factor BamB
MQLLDNGLYGAWDGKDKLTVTIYSKTAQESFGLWQFDITTGELLWKSSQPVGPNPRNLEPGVFPLAGGVVAVNTPPFKNGGAAVKAFDAASGEELWTEKGVALVAARVGDAPDGTAGALGAIVQGDGFVAGWGSP